MKRRKVAHPKKKKKKNFFFKDGFPKEVCVAYSDWRCSLSNNGSNEIMKRWLNGRAFDSSWILDIPELAIEGLQVQFLSVSNIFLLVSYISLIMRALL